MKCIKCNGTGGNNGLECPFCEGNGQVQMTEQEYIQTCTTEQLVETILEMCDYRPCFACGIGYCDDENWCHVDSAEAKEYVLEWLKEIHK